VNWLTPSDVLGGQALTASGGTGQPSGVVVVALPAAADPVHAIAAEDAHVTLAYLGEAAQLPEAALEAALANIELLAAGLGPFDVSVNGTAVLGEDRARVLLVEAEALTRLRELLLTSPELAVAARAAEHPAWIPHLTLSYEQDADLADAEDVETVRIAALAVWAGPQRTELPLTGRARATVRPEWDDDTVTASLGTSFPTAETRDDLPLLIRIADRNPAARWYAVKRAATLGALELLPDWPEVGEVPVSVGRSTARITADRQLVSGDAPARAEVVPLSRRQRRRLVALEPVLDPPVRDPHAGNGGYLP
jgi:2'-5' RNA ligase